MRDLLLSAAERGIRFRESLPDRRVYPTQEVLNQLKRFEEPLPEKIGDPQAILSLLDEIGTPAAVGMAGGRYFGFVIGSSMPVTVAANWLATAWDQNAGLFVGAPVPTKLEEVSLGWMIDLFGLSQNTAGAFVTGATVANFTALAAARRHVLLKAGWDVDASGLFDAPPIEVVVSEEAHQSVLKSLGMLGLGRERVIRVPVDEQGRMRADRLPEFTQNMIVCVQAGNVNTGAFDPIAEVCLRAKQAGTWVHVDGAFGLWAAVTPNYAHLVEGIEQADSWATDAHKWLNVPYDSGLAFVRHADALVGTMTNRASYLIESDIREPSFFTPELSRRGRGVEVWAALRYLGREGLAELVERNCRQARRFAEGLQAAGHEVLNDVVLNQVLVKFGDAEKTRQSCSAFSRTAPAGAVGPSGRVTPPCASVSHRGRPPTPMSSAAWKRW